MKNLVPGVVLILAASGATAGEPADLAFKSRLDGSEQRYVLIRPDGLRPDERVSVLVVLHGHGSDRWQFVKDGRDECRAARDAASKRRMLFVSPDYRARTSWMGPAAEADMVQILAELKERFRVEKVVISGGSMGGTAALTFAALHPDLVDGVVSMNGTANLVEYDQFQDAISASFGGPKRDRPEEYRKRSAEFAPDRLRMPIALTTGGRDTIVPPESVLRLVRRLREINPAVRSIHRTEGGHATNYADAAEAFDFVLDRLLKPAPSN